MPAIIRLPNPPEQYNADYMRQLIRVLTTYIIADTSEDAEGQEIDQIQVPYTATVALNTQYGNVFDVGPLTGNITSFSLGVPPLGQGPNAGITAYVYFTQGAGGNTVTWPTGAGNGAFKWAGGTPGTLSVGAGAVDLLSAVFRIISTASPPVGYWYVRLDKAFA